jgi:NADH-quinone oxidoreductase subunit L
MITAFYMTRQWVMVFLGQPRWQEGVHPHESPRVMTIPLMVLALLSLVGGLVNTPWGLQLEHFLEPVFENVELVVPQLDLFWVLAVVSVLAGVAGVTMGYLAYNRPVEAWEKFQAGFGRIWGAWERAYGVDDIYGATIVKPGKAAADAAAFKFDLPIIDGAVNGMGWVVRKIGSGVRLAQTGFVRNYAGIFVAGVLVVVVWMIVGGGGI